MPHIESDFEEVMIERLKLLGYTHRLGGDMRRTDDWRVIFAEMLAALLAKRYPNVPEATRAEAVQKFIRPEGIDTLRRRGIKAEDLDPVTDRVIEQATALFQRWPIAA